MKKIDSKFKKVLWIFVGALLILAGCSSDRAKNLAKESAARFWQDKAYPGKSFDVQVIEAEKAEGGYRVKGIVDGETRVGIFNPDTETFSEGYYSLAHERNKRIAELEEESKYWKDKVDVLEKENYKLKVQISMLQGKSLEENEPPVKKGPISPPVSGSPSVSSTPSPAPSLAPAVP